MSSSRAVARISRAILVASLVRDPYRRSLALARMTGRRHQSAAKRCKSSLTPFLVFGGGYVNRRSVLAGRSAYPLASRQLTLTPTGAVHERPTDHKWRPAAVRPV